MKKEIGFLSIFCSVMLISYSIFGWVWAATYTITTTKIYENADAGGSGTGNVSLGIYSGTTKIAFTDPNSEDPDNDQGVYYAEYVGGGTGDCGDGIIFNSGGSDDWDCYEFSDGTGFVDMELNASGNPRVAYYAGGYLTYAECDSNCTSGRYDESNNWTTTLLDIDAPTDVDLEIDSSGNISIAYIETGTPKLRVARKTDTGSETSCEEGGDGMEDWDCMNVDTTGVDVAPFDLEFNNSGEEMIIYTDDSDNNVNFAEANESGSGCESGWKCISIDTDNRSLEASMATYGSNVHVAYSLQGANDEDIVYNECSGTCDTLANWGTKYTAVDTGDFASGVNIDTDSSGIPFISATTETFEDAMALAEYVGGSDGNCPTVFPGDSSNKWDCSKTGNVADYWSGGETDIHFSEPKILWGSGGGVYYSEGEEPPLVPEFTSKLVAVLIGASALGLFGLIVLFRGQNKRKKV